MGKSVHLIHFDEKYYRVQHYIGVSDENLDERMEEHRKMTWDGEKHGSGALIVGVINSRGLTQPKGKQRHG